MDASALPFDTEVWNVISGQSGFSRKGKETTACAESCDARVVLPLGQMGSLDDNYKGFKVNTALFFLSQHPNSPVYVARDRASALDWNKQYNAIVRMITEPHCQNKNSFNLVWRSIFSGCPEKFKNELELFTRVSCTHGECVPWQKLFAFVRQLPGKTTKEQNEHDFMFTVLKESFLKCMVMVAADVFHSESLVPEEAIAFTRENDAARVTVAVELGGCKISLEPVTCKSALGGVLCFLNGSSFVFMHGKCFSVANSTLEEDCPRVMQRQSGIIERILASVFGSASGEEKNMTNWTALRGTPSICRTKGLELQSYEDKFKMVERLRLKLLTRTVETKYVKERLVGLLRSLGGETELREAISVLEKSTDGVISKIICLKELAYVIAADASRNRFDEAIETCQKAVQLAKDFSASDSITTVNALSHVACLQRLGGRYQDALATEIRVLQLRRQIFETDMNRDCVISLSNMGNLYVALGDYERAIAAHVIAVKSCESAFGDTLELAKCLNNLAMAYRHVSKWDKAWIAMEKAGRIIKDCGEDGLAYASHLNNRAALLREIGDFSDLKQAEYILREAVEISSKMPNSENHVVFLLNLGTLLHRLGKFSEAEGVLNEARGTAAVVVGTNHSVYAAVQCNLGILADRMGNVSLAKESFNTAREIFEKVGGKKDLILDGLRVVASLALRDGNTSEARKWYLEMLKYFSEDHPQRWILGGKLGHLMVEEGLVDVGDAMLTKAISDWRRSCNKPALEFGLMLRDAAQASIRLKKLKIAEERLIEAMEVIEMSVGKQHVDYALCMASFAFLEAGNNRIECAVALFDDAKRMVLQILGERNLQYGHLLVRIGSTKLSVGIRDGAVLELMEGCAILNELESNSVTTKKARKLACNALIAAGLMEQTVELCDGELEKILLSQKVKHSIHPQQSGGIFDLKPFVKQWNCLNESPVKSISKFVSGSSKTLQSLDSDLLINIEFSQFVNIAQIELRMTRLRCVSVFLGRSFMNFDDVSDFRPNDCGVSKQSDKTTITILRKKHSSSLTLHIYSNEESVEHNEEDPTTVWSLELFGRP